METTEDKTRPEAHWASGSGENPPRCAATVRGGKSARPSVRPSAENTTARAHRTGGWGGGLRGRLPS